MKNIGLLKHFILTATSVFCLLFLSDCGNKNAQEHFSVGIVCMNAQAADTISGFRKGMKSLGYIEGENLTIIFPGHLNTAQEAGKVAQQMIDQKVDLIYAITTPATKKALAAAKNRNTPIIFGPLHSPKEAGLIQSYEEPGANITGVQIRGSEKKTLEWFKLIKPATKKVYIPLHKGNGPAERGFLDVQAAAAKLNIEITSFAVKSKKDLEEALLAIPQDADALLILHSFLLVSNTETIVAAATRRQLPVITPTGVTQKGVLLSYGPSAIDLGKQLSFMADRILKGIPANSIPIQTAEFFLGVNLKKATEIGVDIPEHIINQARFIDRN